MEFAAWFFGFWLFPLIPMWIIYCMADGELQTLNPLKWEDDLRAMLSVWTLLCWVIGAMALLIILLPQP